MPEQYTPRLSIEISKETFLRMQNLIPWGLKTKVMVMLLEDLLDLVEAHGNIVLAAILDRRMGSREVIKELRGKELDNGAK
ncbi:MAG: hypothetical protein WC208_17085 [Gallionella sp.]